MKSKKWLLLFLVFLSSCQSTSFYPEEDKIPLQKNENYQKPQDVPYEKLEYENMKLRIENERLKKGYLVKGDGSVVVFKK